MKFRFLDNVLLKFSLYKGDMTVSIEPRIDVGFKQEIVIYQVQPEDIDDMIVELQAAKKALEPR